MPQWRPVLISGTGVCRCRSFGLRAFGSSVQGNIPTKSYGKCLREIAGLLSPCPSRGARQRASEARIIRALTPSLSHVSVFLGCSVQGDVRERIDSAFTRI